LKGEADTARLDRSAVLERFSLTGRRALVTGGGGGLGAAMAGALYEAGAELAIIGRSVRVDEVAARIAGPGAERPVAIRADLSDRRRLESSFREAVERLGGIDVLVTSHGVVNTDDSLKQAPERWDETLEINLTSVFRLCQLAARAMLAEPREHNAKIVNVASLLSFSGGLRVAAYAASKGGVAQLTKALANEWAGRGVNVNAIAPGYVRTRLNEHVWRDPVRSEQILARLPAGRWGEPDDLKGAAVFLASSASDYVNGAIVPVDGGFLAR
jgi:2-dehydro-3-deoxy-D-gluconate 5-dehydrogenase